MNLGPPRLSATSATIVSLAAGAILWLATSALTGHREAWDASAYWSVTYPLSVLAAGLLGYLVPVRSWRWGVGVMMGQALTMVVLGRSFGLLPLGVIVFGVLAVPPAWVARWAAAKALSAR